MDYDEIRRWWGVFVHPGALVEVRVISDEFGTESGYFSDMETLLQAIARYDNFNIYYSINEVKSACSARKQYNQIMRVKRDATSDSDISHRWWLPIDVDAERTSGVSSTDEEKEAAHQLAGKVYTLLRNEGFADPVVCDSSSGYHIMYPIDLDNTPANTETIKKFLSVLSDEVSNDKAHVDKVLFNASRILRMPGTFGRKGRNTDERPHRLAHILTVPDQIVMMGDEPMRRFIQKYQVVMEPPTSQYERREKFNIYEWLRKYNIGIKDEENKGGATFLYLENGCVFDPSHKGKDASIRIDNATGAIGYKCFHNSCAGKRWRDVRLLFEPDAYDREWKLSRGQQERTGVDEPKPQKAEVPTVADEDEKTKLRKRFKPLSSIEKLDISQMPKVKSGFREIDRLTGGLLMSEVTVLSGTSASGKSTWLNTLALNVVNQGVKVVMVNIEQTERMLKNWIQMVAAGDSHVIPEERKFADDEIRYRITEETGHIIDEWLEGKFYLYADDESTKWDDLLASLCVMAEDNVRFFILDNLMSLDMSSIVGDKWEQQKQVISMLQKFAKKYACHCMIVAHPRKPQGFIRKYDISGSSDITNLADNIFIMHRANRDFYISGQTFYPKDEIERYYKSLPKGNVMEIVKNRTYGVQDRLVPFIYSTKSRRFECAAWGVVDELVKDETGKNKLMKVQGFRAQHFTYDCELKMSSIPDAPMNSFRGDGATDMQTSEEDYPF